MSEEDDDEDMKVIMNLGKIIDKVGKSIFVFTALMFLLLFFFYCCCKEYFCIDLNLIKRRFTFVVEMLIRLKNCVRER